MLVVFNKVDRPPPGAWRDDLHRSEPQSAFWHIGAMTNSTNVDARLAPLGIKHLPLFTGPTDTTTVWRSGLAPYAGTLSAKQLATAQPAAPRDGGFSYVVAPDGVLFELTGGPTTRDAFSHMHFYHEKPLCAANWYVEQLGMELPPVRDSSGVETPRQAVESMRRTVRRGRLASARADRHHPAAVRRRQVRERVNVVVSAPVRE